MTTTGPKIIGFAATKSRAFRCLWMLEEIGIPYQFIYSTPQSPQVLKYNPLGKIPILVEEDGFVLYDSGAIITYLGDKYRDSDSDTSNSLLVPRAGTKERGLYDQTMSVIQTELDSQGLWIHRKHEVMGEYFTYIPDAVNHARKYFNRTNRILIQQLKDNNNNNNKNSGSDGDGGGPYLLGSNFTAVDIMYVHCLNWSKAIGWDNKWNDDITIKQYMDLCMTRSAYQKASSIKDEDYNNNNSNMQTTTATATATSNTNSKL
jgi:glutathione S-transferase